MKNKTTIWHKGGCHCGAVTFEVRAPVNAILTACNCSICNMTGFLHLIVPAEDFRLLTGADNITTYTFNTHAAKHTFCQTCGVKPFYTPRSHPDGISVNFRCVEQSRFETVTSEDFDGRNWEDNIAELRKEE
ncbi:MAG: GFA family protein [Robiginitomaculum sp.]|nr:GFA family protein [Robiginitomaculum sp.]